MRSLLVMAAVVVIVLSAACGAPPGPPTVPLARTCAEWAQLDLEDQLTTAEALVADRLEAAREAQQLPATATREEIVSAVNGSIYKVCLIERRPGMPLTEVIRRLYR